MRYSFHFDYNRVRQYDVRTIVHYCVIKYVSCHVNLTAVISKIVSFFWKRVVYRKKNKYTAIVYYLYI